MFGDDGMGGVEKEVCGGGQRAEKKKTFGMTITRWRLLTVSSLSMRMPAR